MTAVPVLMPLSTLWTSMDGLWIETMLLMQTLERLSPDQIAEARQLLLSRFNGAN